MPLPRPHGSLARILIPFRRRVKARTAERAGLDAASGYFTVISSWPERPSSFTLPVVEPSVVGVSRRCRPGSPFA